MRRRRSSPKLIALNTALISAAAGLTYDEARADRAYWGRLVESAVGAHLVAAEGRRSEVLYWRDRGREVDFVIERGRELLAVEVKSGRARDAQTGLKAFGEATKGRARPLIVGGDGRPLEDFLMSSANIAGR